MRVRARTIGRLTRLGVTGAGLFGLGLVALLGSGCESAPLTPTDRAKQAVRYHKEAVAKATDGRIEEAIVLLEKGKKLQPDHKLLRYDLGRLYLRRALGTDVKSIVAEQTASRSSAEGDQAAAERERFESRALRQSAWRDFGRAKVELLFVEPYLVDRRPNVFYFLSQVHTGLDDFENALAYLDKATEAASNLGVRAFVSPERIKRMRRLLIQGRERQEQKESAGSGD